jgi:quinol monooxygenase YgiN
MALKIYKPTLGSTPVCAMVVGLGARNLRGFFFLWTQIVSFVRETKRADGCRGVCPGISSLRRLILVSYWRNREALQAFARSPAHVEWMRFIAKHPDSLDLFNETYGQPVALNTINARGGFTAAAEKEETTK